MQKYQEKDIFKRVRRLGTLKKKQHTGIHIIETYPSSSINNPTAQKELTSKLKLKKKKSEYKNPEQECTLKLHKPGRTNLFSFCDEVKLISHMWLDGLFCKLLQQNQINVC